MVAQAPDGRTGRLAGAAGIALVLVGLTLLLEPASWRALAAVLLALGLAVGVVVAVRRPASSRPRTPMERLNDGAFLVVIAIVALIAVRLARPWTAALPRLLGGAPPHPRTRRSRLRPRGNPWSRYRAPRRGSVGQPRKRWRRLPTRPTGPPESGP